MPLQFFRRRRFALPFVLVIAIFLGACGGGGGGEGGSGGGGDAGNGNDNGNDTGNTVISTNGAGTVSSNGGTIKTPDGVAVTLPAGALDETVTLRIARDGTHAPELPVGMTALSPVYEITPHVPYLDKLAQVEIPFDANQLPAGEKPYIMIAEPGGGWVRIDQTVSHNSVAAAGTMHFSHVVVMVMTCSAANPCGGPKFTATAALTGQPAPVLLDSGTARERYQVTSPTRFTATVNIDPQSYQYFSPRRPYCHQDARITLYSRTHYTYLKTLGQATSRYGTSFTFDVDAATRGNVELTAVIDCGYNDDDPKTSYLCAAYSHLNHGGCMSPGITVGRLNVNIAPTSGAPSVTRHPTDLAVTAGQSASFAVAGTAPDNLTIAWERSNDGGTSWTEVQAAITAATSTYTLNAVALSDADAWFRAVLCNGAGSQGSCVRSAHARLTVTAATVAPRFVQRPADTGVLEGQTAHFAAIAAGTPPPEIRFYQVGPAGGTDVEVKRCPAVSTGPVNTCSYVTAVLAEEQSGTQFYAVASNSAGTVSTSKAAVTVTREPVLPAVVIRPALIETTLGGTASITVTATGTAPLSYQWRLNDTALTDRMADNASGIQGADSAALTISNAQSADAGMYSVMVSNGAGSVISQNVQLIVRTAETSWIRQAGTTLDDFGTDVATDGFGNTYVTGSTVGAFDGFTAAGGEDAFLIKYGPAGTRLWTTQWGTTERDYANGVASDADGNVYVAGTSVRNADGYAEIFLAKFDANGVRQWTRTLGSGAYNAANGVTVDAAGDVVVVGEAAENLDSANYRGLRDAFVAKFSPDGTRQWVRQIGSPEYDSGAGVTTDGSNHIFVVGSANGALDSTESSPAGSVMFVARFAPDGTRVWSQQLGASTPSLATEGKKVRIGADGKVYVAGETMGALGGQSSQGGQDIFVARYSADGKLEWADQLGSSAFDQIGGLAVDVASGEIYVAGTTSGNLLGASNAGLDDGFIVTIADDGGTIRAQLIGTQQRDGVSGLALAGSRVLMAGGSTRGNMGGVSRASVSTDVFVVRTSAP